MIKHGGRSKVPALRTAQRIDRVVVIDNDRDLPIRDIEFLHVSKMTAQAVLEAVADSGIQPSACLTYVDPAGPVAAEVAWRLSLPGLAPATAKILKDKVQMRRRLAALGIDAPRFHVVNCEADLDQAAAHVGFPCVLKPATAAYGLGVRRIDSQEMLHADFDAAVNELNSGSFARFFPPTPFACWLVEEYLFGPELSIEVLGHPHRPVILAVHEKVVAEEGGHFREDRFVTAPFLLARGQLRFVREEAARICSLLGFNRGVGNLEARLTGADKLRVIELQTAPAGGMVSSMVRHSHGVDLHELHALSHMRWEPLEQLPTEALHACAMGVLHGEKPGRYRIAGISQAQESEGVVDVQILAEEGNIREPHSEYLGFICTEAKDSPAAVDRLETALGRILVHQPVSGFLRSGSTRIQLARHFLGLRRPIPSATGGNWGRQERIYCRLEFPDGTVGYGEAAPHPVHGPSVAKLQEEIRVSRDLLLTANLPSALTLAALDAWGCSINLPIWDALGWPPPKSDGYRTLMTYGGVDPERICIEIADEKPQAVKLKLSGADTDLLIVREIWQAFHRPMALDVNGAWEWDQAVENLKLIEAEDIQLLWVEQPCRPSAIRTKLPTSLLIFADEAVDDPVFDWECYDGIVLKPAKLGLLPCARLGRMAGTRGKATTLGCHLQSSIMTSASLSLGGYVTEEWVDLDSAVLVEHDPFQSAVVDLVTSQIRLAEGAGLAITPKYGLSWGI